MSQITIIPSTLAGTIPIQPSKSFAHRALICAALAQGKSCIQNIHQSQDIQATIQSLTAMNIADFDTSQSGCVIVDGGKKRGVQGEINCGESGSTLRFLIPLALLSGEEHVFTGTQRLMQRPLTMYEDICRKAGILWKLENNKLYIKGSLNAGLYQLAGDVSSQFITGLLLALPLLSGDSKIHITTVLESAAYAQITVAVQKAFGVTIDWKQESDISIKGNQNYLCHSYTAEADYSHAAFHLVAGALSNTVHCTGLPHTSTQPDSVIVEILKNCGALVTYTDDGIKVSREDLQPFTCDLSQCPDLAPILSVLACACKGKSILNNAARLRYKESDRLHAMALELTNLGASVEEGQDYLVINGTGTLRGGSCLTHTDHRVAMALAVASTICTEPVILDDASVVAKSAPEFWEEFKQIGGNYNVRSMGK